jgi:DNA-binding NarL/FixJ family response regulator
VTEPARILVADDDPHSREVLVVRLAAQGYQTLQAGDGEEALAIARAERPDLLLLDVMMPRQDGLAVCRALRADPGLPFMPIILVTARTETRDVVAGLEAGADEYLTKPVEAAALVARVKSMLRIKALHDTVHQQATHLAAQAQELAEWNRTLEDRVQQQVQQMERLGRLRPFLAPQVAELVISTGEEHLLQSHRGEVAVVVAHLRGFATLTETAEPEDVIAVLREFYAAMGDLVFSFEATLERFTEAGLRVFFNDPVRCPDPPGQAARLAVAMRDRARELSRAWRARGHELAFGAGVALGYATLGTIGFQGRFDYRAVGLVPDLAARLARAAQADQVLLTQRVAAAVQGLADVESVGQVALGDGRQPVRAFNLVGLTNAPGRAAGAPGPLSPREREVAVLVARGLTNRQIAEELVVTEGTAAKHIENILNKLGFTSRAQIASWVVEQRLVGT